MTELQKCAKCVWDVARMFAELPSAVLDEWRVWVNR